MPYIIDGYNLLWAIENDDERFEPVDDVRLCWTIGRYLGRIREQGELVFDGAGPGGHFADKSRFDNIPGLVVSFAGIGRDADTVIEGKIKARASSQPLVVVSSDRRLRQAAHQGKATAIRSDAFWERVLAEVRKKRPASEPTAKRYGLSESETDMWLGLFDLEQ